MVLPDLWSQETLDKAESIVKIVGAPVAAYFAWSQWRESNRQRRRELQWKQANKGKQIFDEIIADRVSDAALSMTDSEAREYETRWGSMRITRGEVIQALSSQDTGHTAQYVRDCFDKLFYYLDRARYAERSGLVRRDDIVVQMSYYARKIGEVAVYSAYMKANGFTELEAYLVTLAAETSVQ